MTTLLARALLWTLSIIILSMTPVHSSSEECNVLVVMSYEEDFVWVKEMKEGIEATIYELRASKGIKSVEHAI